MKSLLEIWEKIETMGANVTLQATAILEQEGRLGLLSQRSILLAEQLNTCLKWISQQGEQIQSLQYLADNQRLLIDLQRTEIEHLESEVLALSRQISTFSYMEGKSMPWTVQPIPGAENVADPVELSVLPDGNLLIAYFENSGPLKLARSNGSIWSLSTVDPDPGLACIHSLALGPDGTAFIAYYNDDLMAIMLAQPKPDGSWSVSPIATGIATDGLSLAIDPAGNHNRAFPILFLVPIALLGQGSLYPPSAPEESMKSLQQIWDNASGIDSTLAAQADTLAAHSTGMQILSDRLADLLNDSNNALLSLQGQSDAIAARQAVLIEQQRSLLQGLDEVENLATRTRNLSIAGRTGLYASGGSFPWQIRTIDTQVDKFGSMAIDALGRISIAYTKYDSLVFSRLDGSSWTFHTVLATAWIDKPSLALDPQGVPSIAYKDVADTNLKIARLTVGNTWIITTVDSDGNVGEQASLAFDHDGYPAIAYLDNTRQAINSTLLIPDEGWIYAVVAVAGRIRWKRDVFDVGVRYCV